MFTGPAVRSSPPLGEVIVAAGLSRPRSHTRVRRMISRRIGLEGLVAGSTPLHSKYMVASREGRPPQTAVPGVPSGPPESQRMPASSGLPSPLRQSATAPLMGSTSSPDAPLRCSAYERPPAYGSEMGSVAIPETEVHPAGSALYWVRSVPWTQAEPAGL